MLDRPLFEVTSAAADAAARRLVTAAEVRAIIGSPAGDDSKLETFIDAFSAKAAEHCDLAADSIGTFPTFGRETVRATWAARSDCGRRFDTLILPWRTPITAISSITVDGESLTTDDYRLMPGGLLERLSEERRVTWSNGKIVVTYVAGWSLPTGAPAELKLAAIDQVKTWYFGRSRDGAVLSENVPDTYQATYGAAGGMGMSSDGLLKTVESILDRYRGGRT